MNEQHLIDARRMILAGLSVAKVATKLRKKSADVYRELAAAGLSVRDLRAARRSAIALDLKNGVDRHAVMAKYGASRAYIADVLREAAEIA